MTHFLQYYFALPGHPWYQAGIWGNIFASILWGAGALALGYVIQKKVRAEWAQHKAHERWMAKHLARHLERHGTPVDDHPQHGRL